MSELAVDGGGAATRLQAMRRGQQAATTTPREGRGRADLAASMARSQGDAATRVQAHYRGQKGRRGRRARVGRDALAQVARPRPRRASLRRLPRRACSRSAAGRRHVGYAMRAARRPRWRAAASQGEAAVAAESNMDAAARRRIDRRRRHGSRRRRGAIVGEARRPPRRRGPRRRARSAAALQAARARRLKQLDSSKKAERQVSKRTPQRGEPAGAVPGRVADARKAPLPTGSREAEQRNRRQCARRCVRRRARRRGLSSWQRIARTHMRSRRRPCSSS